MLWRNIANQSCMIDVIGFVLSFDIDLCWTCVHWIVILFHSKGHRRKDFSPGLCGFSLLDISSFRMCLPSVKWHSASFSIFTCLVLIVKDTKRSSCVSVDKSRKVKVLGYVVWEFLLCLKLWILVHLLLISFFAFFKFEALTCFFRCCVLTLQLWKIEGVKFVYFL